MSGPGTRVEALDGGEILIGKGIGGAKGNAFVLYLIVHFV